MIFTPDDIRNLIREALQPITETRHPLWSPNAEENMMMLIAHESQLGKYLVQKGGPALGLGQVEPDTMWDNIRDFLCYRIALYDQVTAITGVNGASEEALQNNHLYNIIHARLKLYRSPGELPPASDPMAMAVYLKLNYNTSKGKATPLQYLADYNRLVLNKV